MQLKTVLFGFVFAILIVLNTHEIDAITIPDINISTTKDTLFHGLIPVKYGNETPHTFPIYNVTIKEMDDFFFSKIPELNFTNESTINFTYKSNSTKSVELIGIMQYIYLTESTRIPQNVSIDINEGGIGTPSIIIYQNDSIIWKNTGVKNHTITNLNDFNDFYVLEPNQTYVRKFTETQLFEYFDEVDGFTGSIDVKNNVDLFPTHTPSFDIPVKFKINVSHSITKITVEIIPTRFDMKHNQERKGVLRISGNETIYDVHLDGEWFIFEKNDFDIIDGIDELIEFTIKPEGIDRNDETNKEYSIDFNLTSSNTEDYFTSIIVFIQDFNFTTESGEAKPILIYETMTPEMMISYCNDKYGDEAEDWEGICAEMRVNITQTVVEERIFHPEISESEAKASLDASKNAVEGVDRLSNKFTDIEVTQSNLQTAIDGMETNLESFKQTVLQKLDPIEQEVSEKKRDSGLFITSAFILLIIGGLIAGTMFIIKKVKEGKPELEF